MNHPDSQASLIGLDFGRCFSAFHFAEDSQRFDDVRCALGPLAERYDFKPELGRECLIGRVGLQLEPGQDTDMARETYIAYAGKPWDHRIVLAVAVPNEDRTDGVAFVVVHDDGRGLTSGSMFEAGKDLAFTDVAEVRQLAGEWFSVR